MDSESTVDLATLDLNLLRVLDVLLAEHSVGQAAARLGMTPSGVSRALGRLRDVFADPLLLRDGRRMVPTAVGEALRGPVGRILGDVGRLLSSAAFDPARVSMRVRLAGADYVEHLFLPRVVARLAREAPGVELHSVRIDRADVDLAEDRVDLAVDVIGALDGPDLVATRLFDDGFVVVLRDGHPALERPWTLDSYVACEHVLVAPRGRPGGVVDTRLAAMGHRRRVKLLVAAFSAPIPVVSETDLVVTLPARIAAVFAPRWPVVVRPTPFDMGRFVLGLHWHARRQRDPGLQWIRERLIEEAAALSRADG